MRIWIWSIREYDGDGMAFEGPFTEDRREAAEKRAEEHRKSNAGRDIIDVGTIAEIRKKYNLKK